MRDDHMAEWCEKMTRALVIVNEQLGPPDPSEADLCRCIAQMERQFDE